MKQTFKRGRTSNIIRVFLQDSAQTDGRGKTGLLFSSTGLIISTIADVEAAATNYTAAGSTTETITTLGTYSAPTATKCRFKEVDSTNQPGVYEVHFADARFNITSSRSLGIMITATGIAACPAEIQLDDKDWSDVSTVGENADAIWDEARSGHVTAGTFGEGVTTVQGQITIRKNTAFLNFPFFMRDPLDLTKGKTSLTGITAKKALDAASSFNNMVNVATIAEIGSGFYRINLDAADVNCDVGSFLFDHTSSKPTKISFITQKI